MPILKTDKRKNGLQGYRVIVNYTDADGSHKKIERAAYGKALTSADLPLIPNAPYFRVSVVDERGNVASTRGFFTDEYNEM